MMQQLTGDLQVMSALPFTPGKPRVTVPIAGQLKLEQPCPVLSDATINVTVSAARMLGGEVFLMVFS